MTELDFGGFDWDEGNSTKSSKKHGVASEAIEALFLAGPLVLDDPRHSGIEKRFIAVGQTSAGRWLVVAFTLRFKQGVKLIRPISARYMHTKEARRYEDLH